MTIKDKIEIEILSSRKGKIYFAQDFKQFGGTDSINKAMERLLEKKLLVRLGHGIYLYPRQSKFSSKILYPSLEKIANAIAERDQAKIIPTGVLALNKLGISTQVPTNLVYLTDGSPRKLKIEKNQITFKKTTPKMLALKGSISLLVIQALKELGKDKITSEIIQKMTDVLQNEKEKNIIHDAKLAPAWISKILFNILKKRDE